jgi:hypothetical protein
MTSPHFLLKSLFHNWVMSLLLTSLMTSLLVQSCQSGRAIPINTRGAQYLMRLQQFLNEFAFHDNDTVYSQLRNNPKFILQNATYNSCPQQKKRI